MARPPSTGAPPPGDSAAPLGLAAGRLPTHMDAAKCKYVVRLLVQGFAPSKRCLSGPWWRRLGELVFPIYFVGAPHRGERDFPDESVDSVDVAILCAPSWTRSAGYPGKIIQRMKPRHIVASHYDHFFQVNHEPMEIVALADLEGFLIRVQESTDYPGVAS